MKELRLKRLTRARMEQWLRENKAKVFTCAHNGKCPVATFIVATNPHIKSLSIGVSSSASNVQTADYTLRELHLPIWAVKLISKVDAEPVQYTSMGRIHEVTAKRTLALLQTI